MLLNFSPPSPVTPRTSEHCLNRHATLPDSEQQTAVPDRALHLGKTRIWNLILSYLIVIANCIRGADWMRHPAAATP